MDYKVPASGAHSNSSGGTVCPGATQGQPGPGGQPQESGGDSKVI